MDWNGSKIPEKLVATAAATISAAASPVAAAAITAAEK
jgi:hypothetical protein